MNHEGMRHWNVGLGHTTEADSYAALNTFLGANLEPGAMFAVYLDANGVYVARRVDYAIGVDGWVDALRTAPVPSYSASAMTTDANGGVSTSVVAPPMNGFGG